VSESKTKKRGASGIGAERLAQLNAGAQAITLTECLAVDFAALMGNIVPGIDDDALAEMTSAASAGISRRMPLAAGARLGLFRGGGRSKHDPRRAAGRDPAAGRR